MNAIIDAAIARARTVLSLLALLLITGAIAYVTIPKEASPDVEIPTLYVSLSLDGVSPADAERLLIRPVEQELQGLDGLRMITSTAYQGGGNVILEFDAGFDADSALTDVREAMDRVRADLPGEADDPTVNEINLSLFPVMVVTLSGDVPERTLVQIARDLQNDVEAIPSVLEATIGGDRSEIIEIEIDPILIESYGLNGNDIITMVNRSNRLVAAGNLDTGSGRFAVTVPGLFEDIGDVMAMPIIADGDAVVTFQDIATIRRTFEEPASFARVNGERAVTLEIVKRSGANIIETSEQVRAVVNAASQNWPDTISVGYTQDQSVFVRDMLTDLQNNVIAAVLLVMIVIVGALGLRSAGLVGIAVPGAFLTGVLIISMLGLTVNIVVLFGLILAVGLLVDGAIIVVELADRKMVEGLPRAEAYAVAAKRMAWPVIASTATTLAAFGPLLFWPGIAGEFMVYLPLTLIATLGASLFMALIFVPVLGSVIGKPGAADPEKMRKLAASETGDIREVGGGTGLYVRMLGGAVRHPGKVIIAAVLILIGVWSYYGANGAGMAFFPEVEPETATVLVHARGNLSIWEEDALMTEVEERVLTLGEEFRSVYTNTGGGGVNMFGGATSEDTIGQIQLEFAHWQERRPASEIQEDIRALTADLAGITIEIREQEAGPPVGKAIQIELASRLPDRLAPAAAQLRRYLESLNGLVDIEDSRPIPGLEWELEVDRAQAARFGLDVTAVGDSIRLVTNGLTIGSVRPDDVDDEVDIIVRYPPDWRTLEQLDHVRVNTNQGAVPISNFVTRSAVQQVGNIARVNGERVMTVQADVAPGVLADDMVQQIRGWIDTEAEFDPAVSVTFRGADQEQAESGAFLFQAFLMAVFVMAIILITQFNSFYSAFLILSAVVMSTVGVLVSLLLSGKPFEIVTTGVAVIALAGIVVNNNIVLIDTYDLLRRAGHPPLEAVLRTGAQRLRPILLTAGTTMLGLVPMSLAMGMNFVTREISFGAPSAQFWTGLSFAIVIGLGFSTLLTLLFTPAALMAKANWDAWRRRAPESEARPQPGLRPAEEANEPAESDLPQAAE